MILDWLTIDGTEYHDVKKEWLASLNWQDLIQEAQNER